MNSYCPGQGSGGSGSNLGSTGHQVGIHPTWGANAIVHTRSNMFILKDNFSATSPLTIMFLGDGTENQRTRHPC